MGPLARSALEVVTAGLGAALGTWAYGSRELEAIATAARRPLGSHESMGSYACSGPERLRLPRWVWAGLAGASCAASLAAVDAEGTLPPVGAAGWQPVGALLIALCCGLALAVLALVDAEQMVVPTVCFRVGFLAFALSLLAYATWAELIAALATAVGALLAFGAWWAISPRSLGLGDVRAASFAALVGGAASPSRCLVALFIAPLAAAIAGRAAGFRGNGRPRLPVPLAPFLAGGGLLTVIGYAR